MKNLCRFVVFACIALLLSLPAYAVENGKTSNRGSNGHWSAYVDPDTVVAVEQVGGNIYLGRQPNSKGNELLVVGSDRTVIEVCIPTVYEGKLVTAIAQAAFADCEVLVSVNIASTVKSIYPGVFFNTPKLETITVHESNPNYYDVDGVLFEKEEYGASLLAYPAARQGEYEIPYGVTEISRYAFAYAQQLDALCFPSTITCIYDAFQNVAIDEVSYFGNESAWEHIERYESAESIVPQYFLDGEDIEQLTNPTVGFPDLSGDKRLSQIREYDEDGEFVGKIQFEYNNSGLLVSASEYTADGIVCNTNEFTYDSQGRLLAALVTDKINNSLYYDCYLRDIYEYDEDKLIYSEHSDSETTHLKCVYLYEADCHIKTIHTWFKDIEGAYRERVWLLDSDDEEREWGAERFAPNLMCGVQESLMFTDSVGHTIWEKHIYGEKKIQLDSEGKIARIIKSRNDYMDFIYENEEVYRIASDDSDLVITVGENLQLSLYHYLDGKWVDSDTSITLAGEEVLAYEDVVEMTVCESDEMFVCVEKLSLRGVAPGTTVVSFTDVYSGKKVQQIEVTVEEMGAPVEYPVLDKMKDFSVEGVTLSDISFEEQNKEIKMTCSAYNQREEVCWLQVRSADDRIVCEIKLFPYVERSLWERIWNELVLLPVKHEAEQGDSEAQRYLLSRTSTMTAVEIEAPYNGRVLLADSEGHEVFEIKIPNLKTEPEWYLVA